MADSWEDRIADAIATELNSSSRSWYTFFTQEQVVAAANARKAWFDLTELDRLKVTVIPATQDRKRLDRSNKREFDYGILIDLQKRVDPADMVTMRALGTAAEAIQEFFDDAHEITGLTRWLAFEAFRRDLYSLPQLYANQVWETLIAVTVRGWR